MPIAQRKSDADIPNPPVLPQTQKETYRGIVADQISVPVDALVAYVDGSPWSVDYYGQLIGHHNDLRELDPGQKAAFQQYAKTSALELRVSSALATSYEQDTTFTSVTGTATVMFLVPNVNDYFVAEAGSRNKGLFRITSVERKVFNRDSVYEINYTLTGFVETQPEVYADLESKVVRTYHFSKDRLVEGIAPIMTEDLYQVSQDLGAAYRQLVREYFRTFMNRSRMTLLVPDQDYVIYDSRLVDFLHTILDQEDSAELQAMRRVSMDQERYLKQDNLWSLLLDRNYEAKDRINQTYKLVPRVRFNRSSWLKGPAFWNFDYYVYPKDVSREVEFTGDALPLEGDGQVIIPFTGGVTNNLLALESGETPVVPPLFKDDYYVLSANFYTATEEQSVLELLVRDYLKHQTLDLRLVKELVDRYASWPALERFYYGPIVMLLVKDTIRGFY